jgi:glutamate/tyrosine decarboxylase-like PLP-dependent enzyme
MDQTKYQHLVDTFFKWDQKSIVTTLEELLSAAAAENSQNPTPTMSQNYETAQSNPEICLLPGNLKDARDAVFPYFWGTDSFNSPLHVENVRGPANNASLIGAFACLLKNPNLCTDRYSQRSNELEVKTVTALANLIFYHTNDPWGVFTIGGTISNLYGAKIGLERVVPGAMQHGIGGQRVVGFCSEASHYSNRSVAGWLGIGIDNLIAIPTDANLSMRLDLLEQNLDECYQSGAKVAYVVATFGTTDGFGIDDLAAIREILDAKSEEYQQPTPQLHVDAAVGWALCFLADYDCQNNPLEFSADLLSIVNRVREACKGLRVVDSVTLDFHKLGRGHYPSSAFLVNHRKDLKYLSRDVAETPYFADAQASRDPALITLECSRPALGPYIVMASLNAIGLTGWQMLTARSLEMAERLKQGLEKLSFCKVLNRETVGAAVDWWVLPKGRDAEAIYQQLVEGSLPEAERKQYFAEIIRTQQKREKMMDPQMDAKLGFTTNFGYKPFGIEVPAWKAVFMNPATDEDVVDRILWSVEESA